LLPTNVLIDLVMWDGESFWSVSPDEVGMFAISDMANRVLAVALAIAEIVCTMCTIRALVTKGNLPLFPLQVGHAVGMKATQKIYVMGECRIRCRTSSPK